MTESIYDHFEAAKNGTNIPILKNGKSLESRYNPQAEAEKLLNTLEAEYKFFLVLGIASGIFIDKLNKKYPDAKIVCFEFSQNDINFLEQTEIIKSLKNKENILFADLQTVYEVLINNYLPAKHGDIKIIEQRAWINENINNLPQIKTQIEKAIKIISADFSVQAHFGKIWQSNIFNNLKLLFDIKNNVKLTPDLSKTALVVAAGPSLDKTIRQIKEKLNQYFIISTDTAYSTLIKEEIIPDIVISIDGQTVSYNHFIHAHNTKTVFYFDLCSNFSGAYNSKSQNKNIVFFRSGHPLCNIINSYCKDSIPYIFTGSGTVTIAAVDLANQFGFKKINVIGADFAYLDGKPYAKGTYLDNLYNLSSLKIQTNESLFTKLMFRTELITIDNNKSTTEILNAYKYSFEEYLKNNRISIKSNNDFYELISDNITNYTFNKIPDFTYKECFDYIINSIDLETALLPYIAWLKNKLKISDYKELQNLAKSHIVSYNKYYE